MKITLVNPFSTGVYPQPPIGLLQVASIAESDKHTVSLIDANALRLQAKQAADTALWTDPDVIGVTATTPVIKEALDIVRHVKARRPDVFTVLGGAHASLLPDTTMKSCPDLDAVAVGEGETSLPIILQSMKKGVYGARLDNTVSNKPVDMDQLPYPAYHLLREATMHKPHPPHGRRNPWMPIITSRGCPYHCTFCSKPVFGGKYRSKDAKAVAEEIKYLEYVFGVREICFYDDVFTLNWNRVVNLCQEMSLAGCSSIWSCETRVDLVDRSLLRLMRQCGCYLIAFGIESGSGAILNQLCKGIDLRQVRKSVGWAQSEGIETIGYFMLGSPGETTETVESTIRLAQELKLDFAQFATTLPFPGTELEKQMPHSVDWDNYSYEGKRGTDVAGDVFTDTLLGPSGVSGCVKRAYRRFYIRPAYIAQRLHKGHWVSDARGLRMILGRG